MPPLARGQPVTGVDDAAAAIALLMPLDRGHPVGRTDARQPTACRRWLRIVPAPGTVGDSVLTGRVLGA